MSDETAQTPTHAFAARRPAASAGTRDPCRPPASAARQRARRGPRPAFYDEVGGRDDVRAPRRRVLPRRRRRPGAAADVPRGGPRPGARSASRCSSSSTGAGPAPTASSAATRGCGCGTLPFNVNPDARDRWLAHMRAAVDALDLSPLHEATLWDYLQRAALAMVNTFETEPPRSASSCTRRRRSAAASPRRHPHRRRIASPPRHGLPARAAPPDDEGVHMPATPAPTPARRRSSSAAGLAGLVAAAEARRRRQARHDRRAGARGEPRRAGVVVVRRALPHRLARAAAHGHQGLARARAPGLVRHAPGSTATRTTGRAAGRRPTSQFAARREARVAAREGRRFFPVVGWAERGGYTATGHGNSVPRFHITWGTGPGVARAVQRARRGRRGRRAASTILARHRVDELIVESGAVVGRARRQCSRRSGAARGEPSNRDVVGDVRDRAPARRSCPPAASEATTTSCGEFWPARLGAAARRRCSSGVPAYVDGAMLRDRRARGRAPRSTATGCGTTSRASRTGIRCGRSTASASSPARRRSGSTPTGQRLPVPLFPGFDTLGTLEHLRATGHDHSWFVLSQKIIEKEFALSGSEQNPDLTGKDVRAARRSRLGKGAPGPGRGVQGARASTSSSRDTLDELFAGMRRSPGGDAARHASASSARSRRATARSTTTSRRTRRSRRCAARASTAATSSSAWPSRTASSTRRRGRSSR